ncbi:MAG: type IV pilus secretin PilQ [Candidatus Omnitrophota bacterium]|jgi:type IV pilus assembly protein PilQ
MNKTGILTLGFIFGVLFFTYAQEQPKQETAPAAAPAAAPVAPEKAENVTLDFKDADIQSVLRIISYKAGVNIVTTPDVIGNVTIRLVDVPWDKALDTVLRTYGFGYERQANIIIVSPLEKLTTQKEQEVKLAQVQPTATEVFTLKYIDAQDAKKSLDPQLSPRGKITVLEMSGQAGWQFAATVKGESMGARKRETQATLGRSKVLIVSDIPPVLEKIREVIQQIDVMPKQVLIEAKIMEVDKDKLRDIGFEWGTGSTGAQTKIIQSVPLGRSTQIGGNSLSSLVKPGTFNPISKLSGITPYDAGFSMLYQKLTGTEFSVLVHALEEDVHTNTLSAPRIMALNNQEATILIGTKYPILMTTDTGAGTTAVTTVTLDYYQDIGIQLNVVPQIGANDYINMVIHPAVSSFASTLGSNEYPIIETREAETRVLMKDGETIVIGGLLKDVKSRGRTGIPFLKDIPWMGNLFQRDTNDTSKIELLVFVSARIIKDNEFSPEQIAKLQSNLNTIAKEEAAQVKKKK